MKVNRSMLAYIAIAIILGAALALAIGLAQSQDNGTARNVSATASGVAGSDLMSAAGGTTGTTDPAKEQPLLDKFVSKDPFLPFGTANVTPSSGGSGSGGSSSGLSAHVKVNGAGYTVTVGDEVPGGTAVFRISGVTSSDVTFAVINGKLKNGDSSVSVNNGETVKVTLENGKSYTLAVTAIGASSSGGGSGGTSGHTISILSVNSSNGVGMATIEVDGKTYSDQKVGAVINTSWGQIKIIAINVNGQTVTIMHGDQTITLRAGQVVAK